LANAINRSDGGANFPEIAAAPGVHSPPGMANRLFLITLLPALAAAEPRLEVTRVAWEPPVGTDALPLVELTWIDDRGARRRLDGSWVSGVAIAGAALVRDVDGTLWRIDASGDRLRIGQKRLAGWFSGLPGEASELWTWDGEVTRRLARGLAGSAGLRFDPRGEWIAFVSARNGGIAGLWLTPVRPGAARCLTNCDLRVHENWHARYRPLPRLDTLTFGDATLRFLDLEGRAQEVRR
jgi:hypothetical protein